MGRPVWPPSLHPNREPTYHSRRPRSLVASLSPNYLSKNHYNWQTHVAPPLYSQGSQWSAEDRLGLANQAKF